MENRKKRDANHLESEVINLIKNVLKWKVLALNVLLDVIKFQGKLERGRFS